MLSYLGLVASSTGGTGARGSAAETGGSSEVGVGERDVAGVDDGTGDTERGVTGAGSSCASSRQYRVAMASGSQLKLALPPRRTFTHGTPGALGGATAVSRRRAGDQGPA